MENKISAEFDAAIQTDVLKKINDAKAAMGFLIDLSPDEIRGLPKMGDKSRAFVAQSLTLAEQDNTYLPRSFDVAEMAKDVALTEALYPVLVAVTQFKELIENTYILAGSDAYSAALIVYQSARNNGKGEALDALLDTLGQRFARKAKLKPQP